MLAAAPEWLEGNVALGSVVVLLLVGLVVIRTVRKMATRLAIIGLLVGSALAVLLQRDEIERCGRTCSCELFALDVDVPLCSPEPF